MSVTLAVLGVALVAFVLMFVVSVRRNRPFDPLDPVALEAGVRRTLWHHPHVRHFLRRRLHRESATGLMLTVCLVIAFVVALGLGALLDLADESDAVAELDSAVSRWGAENASSGAVDVLRLVTHLGSTVFVTCLLTAAALVDFARRRNPAVFAFVAAVGLGELVLNNLLKVVVDRERPSVLQLVGAHGMSFPSGHTAAAAAGWAAAAMVVTWQTSRVARASATAVAVTVAGAVGASRALLGVHWVTDVIGGLLLGWGWFLLVAVVFGGRRERPADPVADDRALDEQAAERVSP